MYDSYKIWCDVDYLKDLEILVLGFFHLARDALYSVKKYCNAESFRWFEYIDS